MRSMLGNERRCQAVPDGSRGIVVGVDISKGKFDYGAFRGSRKTKVRTATQDREGFLELEAFVRELEKEGYLPWIACEPTGPYGTCLREWLQRSGMRVVQVNPYHVRRTKEVRDNSPSKTDQKDPQVIADLVWQGCYQEVRDPAQEYAQLRCAIAEWASLVKKRTACRNELQGLMEVWFPEMKTVFRNTLCKSARAIVRGYADVEALAGARLSGLRSRLGKASSGRTTHRAEDILSAARGSVAARQGCQARRRAMLFLLDALELIELRQEALKSEMSEILESVDVAKHLLSLRGVGVVTVAGLLGECGDIGSYCCYDALEKYVGLNLYEVSSGRHKGQRHISKRGRALARYLICHIAMLQTKSDGLYAAYAAAAKARGKTTGQVRVAVARKLLKLLYALARDRVDFDPQRFTEAGAEDSSVITKGTQLAA